LIYSIVYVDSFLVNNDALCDAMTVTPDGSVALAYTSGGSLGNLSFAKTVSVFQTDQSGPTSMTNFWAQHLEGLLPVRAIDIDSSANVYLLGACVNDRHDFAQPLFPGGYRRQPLDGSHCTTDSVFTTGPSENVLAKSRPGGAGDDEPMAYALDATDAGVAYVAGATRSTSFPVTADAYQSACGGGCILDAFLQAIDTTQPNDASLIYSSYLGDAAEDLATAVHVEASGVVTVAGSGTLPGPGPEQNFT